MTTENVQVGRLLTSLNVLCCVCAERWWEELNVWICVTGDCLELIESLGSILLFSKQSLIHFPFNYYHCYCHSLFQSIGHRSIFYQLVPFGCTKQN